MDQGVLVLVLCISYFDFGYEDRDESNVLAIETRWSR